MTDWGIAPSPTPVANAYCLGWCYQLGFWVILCYTAGSYKFW